MNLQFSDTTRDIWRFPARCGSCRSAEGRLFDPTGLFGSGTSLAIGRLSGTCGKTRDMYVHNTGLQKCYLRPAILFSFAGQ